MRTHGVLGALLPVLACAVCPACLTTYAKLLSVAGTAWLSDTHHLVLLGVALSASLGLSAARTVRTRRAWPLATALTGGALLLAGHFGGEAPVLEWLGVLTLLVGGLVEHFRFSAHRRARAKDISGADPHTHAAQGHA